MPTIFHYDAYRFFFYSNEGNPREPMHVHVMKGRRAAKFWPGPEGWGARSRGVDERTLRRLAAVVEKRRVPIERASLGHFG